MYRQNARDDPRSTMSIVEHNERPNLHRGRSSTFSGYRPYEDSAYCNQPESKQIVPQRRRHSMIRRSRYWDRSDSDSSDSSDDEYYRSRRSQSRPRGRTQSRRPRARSPSSDSGGSTSRSRSRSRRRQQPRTITRPKETYTLTKALKAAATAATVEAVRCRAEPGSWKGQKGQRIAVAAASGAAIGSLRNGRLQKSGKLPYAEAVMTGCYSVDFLKRVLRQTTFTEDAEKERREWEIDEDVHDERRRYARERSRSRRR